MIGLPLAISSWDEKEIQAIERVIKSGHYTMGEEVSRFECMFAQYFGARYAVMVNSGSSANLLAIGALTFKKNNPLKSGDEIIVPSLSWSTTYYPVSQYGMRLVFVDIDLESLNISVEHIQRAITPQTKAIFVPSILGNPADLPRIKAICEKHGLYLIEDNCESMGAVIEGKHVGTYGVCGTFSCFFSHHISTMEGGMVVTDNEELYHILLCLRAHGWTRQLPTESELHKKSEDEFYEKFNFILPGYNLRPLEMSGAIGVEQLTKLPNFLRIRRQNAEHFVSLLSESNDFVIQKEIGSSSWFGFSMILKESSQLNRSDILKKLAEKGIETRPIISGNFLRQPVIKHLSYRKYGDHFHAERVHDAGFFIGNHPIDIRKELDSLHCVLGTL